MNSSPWKGVPRVPLADARGSGGDPIMKCIDFIASLKLLTKTAEQLSESASRTGPAINALGKAGKAIGPIGVAVGVRIAANNVYNASPEQQSTRRGR